MDWNIEFWTIDEEHSFIFLTSEKNNEKKSFITRYFNNSLTRNQKLFIEPSYVILGQDEFLFDLNEKEDIYMTNSKDHIIQKNIFRKVDDFFEYDTTFYQSLSKNSFIYFNTNSNSYLYQIDVIKKESSLGFEVNSTREDIKGQFFILEGKKLFVLNGNKIFIYHF